MIELTPQIDDKRILSVLKKIGRRVENMSPVMADIGELLAESTKRRFVTAEGPDGTPWEPNSQVTLDRYMDRFPTAISQRTGRITKGGFARLASKRPLTGESRGRTSFCEPETTGPKPCRPCFSVRWRPETA